MIALKTYLTKPIITVMLIFVLFVTNFSVFSRAEAETGVGKDVFKVIISLFGISNSTRDIVTIVNVGDQTKVKVYNAEDPENEGLDKVSYTITFPNLAVNDGEPYNVCTMSVDDFKLKCKQGSNSPLNRPEFVDVDVSK
jgi:hypothetical protein